MEFQKVENIAIYHIQIKLDFFSNLFQIKRKKKNVKMPCPIVCFQIVWLEVGLDVTKFFYQNRPYLAGNQYFFGPLQAYFREIFCHGLVISEII